MAVILESNRIPLEPAMPAPVSPECAGQSSPLGASILPGGVNFNIFSRGASGIELLFFDREDDTRPARAIGFDRKANLAGHYWYVFCTWQCNQGSFTAMAYMDHTIRRTGCGSVHLKLASTHTAAPWSFSFRITRAQRRQTEKVTATARTTIEAGTAVSRGPSNGPAVEKMLKPAGKETS